MRQPTDTIQLVQLFSLAVITQKYLSAERPIRIKYSEHLHSKTQTYADVHVFNRARVLH